MALVIKGDFEESVNATPVSLNANGGAHTKVDIDTKGAFEITIQVTNGTIQSNGTITGGNSTNLDVLVYGDVGAGYASIPSGQMNLGTNSSDILLLNTGFYKIKLVIINNDTNAANTTTVNYKVVVKR